MLRTLRAGEVTALYDSGDLRSVMWGETLVCLRLYAAVRDQNWGTVPGKLSGETLEMGEDNFRVRYTSTHRQGDIHFVWHATIQGDPDGTITFHFEGEARSRFRRNRIGFCILHPMQAAGQACQLTYLDSTVSQTTLPLEISPDQPPAGFTNLVGLSHALPGGGTVSFTFTGDAFELEDQRNWTDASFKTFCTPLELPFPVEVKPGERVRQSVTVQVVSPNPNHPQRVPGEPKEDLALFGSPLLGLGALPFPALGLGVPAELPLPDADCLARLRALMPSHVRVDDFDPNGLALAEALGVPVELALHGKNDERREGSWARILALPAAERPNLRPDHDALLQSARAAFPETPIFLGTDADYLFLNRFPPHSPPLLGAGGQRGVTFAISPQVHSFDEASIVETAAAQGVVARDAWRHAGGLGVIVSPLTLLPHGNPYAATPQPRTVPPADPRQSSTFCAAWTLASLKYLAEAGVESITLFETHGPRGVLDTPTEKLLQQLAGAEKVFPINSPDSLKVEILAVEKTGERLVLMANMTNKSQEIEFEKKNYSLEPHEIREIS